MPLSHPDQWFTQEQIDRLNALMAQWRSARDNGLTIPQDMRSELESLVEAELFAAAMRAQARLGQSLRSSNQ